MTGDEYRFSIDWEAEVGKIAREQSLNNVHHLVQLVRHALLHDPVSIHITSTRERLTVSQDGATLSGLEWRMYRMLFADKYSVRTRQRVLNLLEQQTGVVILALVFQFDWLEVATGSSCFIAEKQTVRFFEGVEDVPGWRVTIRRKLKTLCREEGELRFFCAGAAIPVYWNGRLINAAVKREETICPLEYDHDAGAGGAGIPLAGDVSRIYYSKLGVRFGVRHFVREDGRLTAGWWNSADRKFESHFVRSMAAGDFCLALYGDGSYRALAGRFGTLTPARRRRIKRLLTGIQDDGWDRRWGDVPLFHSVRGEFVLSLHELFRRVREAGALPFCARPRRDVPAHLAWLPPEDLHFLRSRFQIPLRLYLTPRPAARWWRWLRMGRSR